MTSRRCWSIAPMRKLGACWPRHWASTTRICPATISATRCRHMVDALAASGRLPELLDLMTAALDGPMGDDIPEQVKANLIKQFARSTR